jgi:hypothetical protein
VGLELAEEGFGFGQVLLGGDGLLLDQVIGFLELVGF